MKQLFSKFLVAFLLTSAVVLSWSEYFLYKAAAVVFFEECSMQHTNPRISKEKRVVNPQNYMVA